MVEIIPEELLQEELPGVSVVTINVAEAIVADVTVVVDGSEAQENIGAANTEIIGVLESNGFAVETAVAIVTSAPSVSPTFTTKLPTASPSVTGIVVTLSLSKAGEVMTEEELISLTEDLAQTYGVSVDDVDVTPTYVVSGSMQLDSIPEDVTTEELESALEQSLADSLGLHPKDIDVSVDPVTGEVVYTVTVDDSDIALSLIHI